MCWSCRWHRGSVTENEIPDSLNISSTQPPPFEDLTQASTTVLSQMLGEVSYLTHTFIVVLFLTWNLHWLYFLSQETLESSLSQPQGPLPDPTFILSNQLVEQPIPLTTSTVAGRAALVKASRPLIRVLVINDNGLWINDFIWDNEYRLIHGWKRFGCERMEIWRWWAKLGLKTKV